MTVSFEITIPDRLRPGDTFKMAAPKCGQALTKREGVQVMVPDGCYPGDQLTVEVDGKIFNVEVPDGCHPGETFPVTAPNSDDSKRTNIKVVVPEWWSKGDDLAVEVAGVQFKVQVPEGARIGESFVTQMPSAEECYHQMAEEKARKEAKAKSKKKKPKQSSKATVAKVTAIAKAAQQKKDSDSSSSDDDVKVKVDFGKGVVEVKQSKSTSSSDSERGR